MLPPCRPSLQEFKQPGSVQKQYFLGLEKLTGITVFIEIQFFKKFTTAVILVSSDFICQRKICSKLGKRS
jgi:hypothetical protein